MSNWLQNTTVIITGAAGGMGKGISMSLIEKYNCKVIGIDINEENLKKVSAELGSKASNFSYQVLDVSKEENWKQFADYLVENDIKPDVLINNAGILPKFNKFGNYTLDYIKFAMDINFFASVYSVHYLMPLILQSNKAAVINVSSSASLCSLAGTSVYSASKSALKGLTESIREEYRGECYVGLVCPGFTKTGIFAAQGEQTGLVAKALDMVSSPCDTMVRKIVSGIAAKRSLMVYGIDAQLMFYGNRAAAVLTSTVSSQVMKLSRAPLFADIFAKSKDQLGNVIAKVK